MSNPFAKARNFVLGVRAALYFLRHPEHLGEVSAAREDKDSIDLDEAFEGARRHRDTAREKEFGRTHATAPRGAYR